MKPRSTILMVVLGLAVALFGCQDQSVVAPDDVQPQFAKGGKKPPPNETARLDLTGVLSGTATTGVTWNYKKELFGIFTERDVIEANLTIDPGSEGWNAYLEQCEALPEGDRADELMEHLRTGLTGKLVNMYVDTGLIGSPSADHRIFSLVEDGVVSDLSIGPRSIFGADFPDDATVTGFEDTLERIHYTLTGGVIGLRGTGGPKDQVMIACPNLGYVEVTVTK